MDDFKIAYTAVFDDKNKVKTCGRLACIKLISICNTIDPNTDYGDVSTGFMNTANIIELNNKLKKLNF